MSVTIEDIDAAIALKKAEQAAEIDAAIAAKQKPPGSTIDSVVEPIKTIASGVGSSIAGGIAGIDQALNPFAEKGAGAQTAKAIQEAGTYRPKTQAGEEGLKNLFSAAEEITNMLSLGGMVPTITGGVTHWLTDGDLPSALKTAADIKERGMPTVMADKTLEITNSPLAATAVYMSPDIGEMLLGGGLIKSSMPTNASKSLALEIQSGAKSAAKEKAYIDNGAGFIINGPIEAKKAYKEAVKQGIDPGVAALIQGSHPSNKLKMASMMDILKKSRKDPLYAVDNRPSDIAGLSQMERVNYVKAKNTEAAQQLDTVAKTLKGQHVDITDSTRQFADNLDEFGIKLIPDNKGGVKADFSESSLHPSDFRAIKNVIRQMSRLSKNPIDGYTIHELKKIIDRDVSYGKKNTALSSEAEGMLKGFRHRLDGQLDAQFPAYNDVNTTYSQTREALDEFQDLMGRKIDLFGNNAHKAVGVKLRGLTSNITSRTPLDNAINKINETAANHGGVFDDSVKTLMILAEELDAKIRIAAKTSIHGEMGKAARRAATQSKGEAALEAAAAVKDAALGVNPDNAIKSIEALLK